MLTWNGLAAGCALVACWFYRDAVGDAYGPMIGLFFGVPATLGSALMTLIPTMLFSSWSKSPQAKLDRPALWLTAALAPAALGVMTFLTIAMPRTHGSGC